MTSRRRFLLLSLACSLLIPIAARSEEPHRSRLVVDNRSGSTATIYIWRHDGKVWNWRFVVKVEAGKWVPIYDLRNQERLRARIHPRGEYLFHTVNLNRDKNGALQDLWRIKRAN